MTTLKASEQGLTRIKQARREKGWTIEDPNWLVEVSKELEPNSNWTPDGPYASGIAQATWRRFLQRIRINANVFKACCKVLGLNWEEIVDRIIDPPNLQLLSDWRQVCSTMLEAQNQGRLTTNPLTTVDGVVFELDEIYVPLGLVERKQRDRFSEDVSPEEGSQLYQPEIQDEITQTFQQDEFFEQVLRPGRSKRIAIIGEPGAGKTTLLQKIAAWVLDNTCDVPIWISLADLQGKTLEQYLLSDWLKAATRKVRVTEAMEEALGELFNSKRVWLLLDAVDEMAVGAQSLAPLQSIANQITGWVSDARVVLTCRLNVWDAGKNALEAFETYRNLDFSYGNAPTPDQVGQFIRCWFKSKPVLGESLRTELNQPGKERIKDGVKNPLRLALLCRTWALAQGGLPNTKAGLYQQFTEALYEWKQDRFPTSSIQRQELKKALGELALQAIASSKTKFRLRHRLVSRVLGQPDADLFKLALQLGLLNQVGVAAEAENRGEKVYAFYHPTFQEYFVAQAIDDWHFFLNHTPHNPTQGTYRIFEPSWKEVILLWLGREEVSRKQKEDFIKALVEFEDGCKDFYGYRAYFLAAAGIAEFRDCSGADEIVTQIVQWAIDYFNIEKPEVWILLKPIEEGARSTLLETERSKAIRALMRLIKLTKNEWTCWQAADSLGTIDPGNEIAIAVLVQLIESNEDESIRWQAAVSLGEIDPGNETAIAALVQLIESTENESPHWQVIDRLGEIGNGNQTAVRALVQLIESTQSESIRRQVADTLGKIDPGNGTAVRALVQLIESTEDESTHWQATDSLGNLGQGNETAIQALIQLIESTDDESIRRQIVDSLGKIGTCNQTALSALVQLIESTKDESTRRQAADSLGKIDPGNEIAIAALVQLIESTKNDITCRQAAFSLGNLSQGNEKVISALVQLIESTKNELNRRQMVDSLGKIGNCNQTAISALVQLIELTKDESTRRQAADSLGKIDSGNERAISALVQLIESTKNKFTRRQAADSLGKIGTCNQTVIRGLVQLIESTEDEDTHWQVAERLGQIDPGNQIAIRVLEQLIESTEDEFIRRRAAESLGKIGNGNETAITTLVQLIESTKSNSTRWQAAESLKKILRDGQLAGIVTVLKDYLSNDTEENDVERFHQCYKLIWHCAQIMPYPDFYQAWHGY